MDDLLYKDEVYRIIGAAMEVHRELGHGFLEAVYQEAFERELASQSIPYASQQLLKIAYKGQPLAKEYCADIVCYGSIILELKALPKVSGNEESQVINYLKATGMKVGLLINFGSPGKLEWKRLVF